MTNEQWLVYLWSVYPDGGFLVFWFVCLAIFMFLLIFDFLFFIDDGGYDMTKEDQQNYMWYKLGLWKISIPTILLIFILLSNLVPKRDYFLYIVATPYVVDSGKSIIDSLQDPNSKLSKLNQMTDKALDKALMYLGENENEKQNKN